jgi:hypothetical protein
VLGALGAELYFASGAYRRHEERATVSEDRMIRFFDEARPLLRALLPVAPGRTIHNVVEIAAANTDHRPREAFLLIAEAVEAAGRVGYETDGLARDLVLGVVQRYLSDRRELFHGPADEAQQMRDALVAILDSFVGAGWPQARGLAYHLQEVFR